MVAAPPVMEKQYGEAGLRTQVAIQMRYAIQIPILALTTSIAETGSAITEKPTAAAQATVHRNAAFLTALHQNANVILMQTALQAITVTRFQDGMHARQSIMLTSARTIMIISARMDG